MTLFSLNEFCERNKYTAEVDGDNNVAVIRKACGQILMTVRLVR